MSEPNLEEKVELKLFDGRNFVLKKATLLSMFKKEDLEKAWANGGVNTDSFLKDLSIGRLNPYAGESVAYYAGIFCGHSAVSKDLFMKCLYEYCTDTALAYLATFQVPRELKEGSIKFEKSSGMFLPTMDWYRYKMETKE